MSNNILHNLGLKVSNNYPAILTGFGVVGVVVTSALTVRATVSAVRTIDEAELTGVVSEDPKVRIRDRSELVWKMYIPPVLSATATIFTIIAANRSGSKRAAALAAAYSISQRAFTDYKDKVREHIGAQKEQAVRESVSRDRIEQNPVRSSEVILAGGETLCFDEFTGRYFKSDIETLRRAQNDINYQLLSDMYVSLSDFYSKIGLPRTSYSDEVGWTVTQKLELTFTACLSDNGTPCIAMRFSTEPRTNYNKFG